MASLIKCAVFISEFVTVPWVHVDIAGTALPEPRQAVRAERRHRRGVCTLVRLALDFASDDLAADGSDEAPLRADPTGSR